VRPNPSIHSLISREPSCGTSATAALDHGAYRRRENWNAQALKTLAAHWGMPDPAAVEGSDKAVKKASLDRMAIQREIFHALQCLPPSRTPRLLSPPRFGRRQPHDGFTPAHASGQRRVVRLDELDLSKAGGRSCAAPMNKGAK